MEQNKVDYYMDETNRRLESIERKIDDLMGYRNKASGAVMISVGIGSTVISALVAIIIHFALAMH